MTLLRATALAIASVVGGSEARSEPVEDRFARSGPFGVEVVVTSACDREANLCDLFYPRTPAGDRRTFPVITWGNGTDKTPSPAGKYEFLLRHLASWGFIVIATRDGATGTGDTVLDAADFARRAGDDPSSPLFGRVKKTSVGAAGHSQGASGAANAVIKSAGTVRTAVLFHLPQQVFCNPADSCLRTQDLREAQTGSLFYISGSKDFVISPDWLPGGGGKLNSNTAYYEATPPALQEVKGILKGGDHNDILGRPACPSGQGGCSLGANPYLAFPTAWLVWRLQGENLAEVFTDGGALQRSSAWTSVRTNVRN